MKIMKSAHCEDWPKDSKLRHLLGLGLSLPALLAGVPAAQALTLYNGPQYDNNVVVNLNIGTTYTGMLRVGRASQILLSGETNANANDGDANLQHGIVNNVFEVLPVLDIKDGHFGMHFSGEYFINTVYLGTTNNDQTSTINPILPKSDDYASQTRTSNGMNGRMLDAFVYGSWAFGEGQHVTLKAGQQTLFWGQSLFSVDGISGGQAPLDLVQAQNLVNPQSQQVFLPVGQIVATYQPNATYTFQGYYQYQWAPYAFQGVGSYFSPADVLGPGGYRIIAEQLAGTNFYLNQTKALTPRSQNGQFGLSVQAQYGDYDLGLFMLRYDAKTPSVYELAPTGLTPTPGGYVVGTYKLVYPRDIWLYGASLSTTIGATNIAGEVSLRTHDPLAGGGASGVQSAENMGNANNDPLYPVGNVLTSLANFIYGTPALKYDPGGITFLGEAEWVDLLRVTDNKQFIIPGRTSNAASINLEIEPTYYEVFPSLELQFPMSVNDVVAGNSQVSTSLNHGTGGFALGITATYHENWTASLNYVGYIGKVGTSPAVAEVSANPPDRAYISLNLAHTF